MTSTGIDRVTGKPISGWSHVQQSIAVLLSTHIGTRVLLRDFGSKIPDLVDAKMTRRTALAVYSAAAEALEAWEPRFRLVSAAITEASSGGRIALALTGIYFPRGHLGDWSVAEDASVRVSI